MRALGRGRADTSLWRVPLPCFKAPLFKSTLEQHTPTLHLSGWGEAWGLFFFSHTPVLCSLSGAGGCEDELAARSGSGLLVFSAAAGTGVVFLSPRRSEGGSAPGSGADYPSGGGGAWI